MPDKRLAAVPIHLCTFGSGPRALHVFGHIDGRRVSGLQQLSVWLNQIRAFDAFPNAVVVDFASGAAIQAEVAAMRQRLGIDR